MDKAQRDKISKSLKGRTRSKATRDKISKSMRGKSNFEGQHHDKTTKRELRRERGHDDRVEGRRWRTDKSTNDESRTYSKGDSSRYRWGRALSEWLEMQEDHGGSGPCFYIRLESGGDYSIAEYTLSDEGWTPMYVKGSRSLRPTLPPAPRGMSRDHAVCWLTFCWAPKHSVKLTGPYASDEEATPSPITELSTDLLAKYKTAAAADASAADKRGDFKRGDKRFRGIVRATKHQFDNDARARQAKLTERFDTVKGTYVCVEYDADAVAALLKPLKSAKIPDLYTPNLIHTTLMYSTDGDYVQVPPTLIGEEVDIVDPEYKIYGKRNDTLVIAFKSKVLEKRHQELKKLGLKHSWDEYSPHITLSESVDKSFDTTKLPKITIKKLKVMIEKSTPIKE